MGFSEALLGAAASARFFDPFFSHSDPSAIDSECIKPLSVLDSGLKREW